MTEEELMARVAAFEQRLKAAQDEVGVPSLAVYAFARMGEGAAAENAVGGETISMPGSTDKRAIVDPFARMITLMGHIGARFERLKQEQSAQHGPMFSVVLHRGVQGNFREGSPMEEPGFPISLTDLARSYGAAVIGSVVLSDSEYQETPYEYAAFVEANGQPVSDLIPALAAVRRGYDDLIEQAARNTGLDAAQLRAMVDKAYG